MEYKQISILILIVLVASSLAVGGEYLSDKNTTKKKTPESNVSETGNDSTNRRYVNVYEHESRPEWEPVDDFSFKEHQAPAYEFTRYPDRDPTEEELDEAWELYNRSFEAAKQEGYFSFRNSVVTNFGRNSDIGLKDIERRYIEGIGNHYSNLHYLSTNESLNPHKPELLVYYDNPENDKKILAGYMYNKKPGTHVEGEQIGGPLTVWHSHDMDVASYVTALNGLITESEDFNNIEQFANYYGFGFETGDEYYNKMGGRTAEMIHVWFIKHPEGPFATRMAIPPEYLKKPEKMSEKEFKEYAMRKYNRYFKER